MALRRVKQGIKLKTIWSKRQDRARVTVRKVGNAWEVVKIDPTA